MRLVSFQNNDLIFDKEIKKLNHQALTFLLVSLW